MYLPTFLPTYVLTYLRSYLPRYKVVEYIQSAKALSKRYLSWTQAANVDLCFLYFALETMMTNKIFLFLSNAQTEFIVYKATSNTQ